MNVNVAATAEQTRSQNLMFYFNQQLKINVTHRFLSTGLFDVYERPFLLPLKGCVLSGFFDTKKGLSVSISGVYLQDYHLSPFGVMCCIFNSNVWINIGTSHTIPLRFCFLSVRSAGVTIGQTFPPPSVCESGLLSDKPSIVFLLCALHRHLSYVSVLIPGLFKDTTNKHWQNNASHRMILLRAFRAVVIPGFITGQRGGSVNTWHGKSNKTF